MSSPNAGDLVVVPGEPELGFGRLERIFRADEEQLARVLLYDDGRTVIRPLRAIAPCPPGVWDKTRRPSLVVS